MRFLLMALFLLIGINGAWAVDTKTVTFDFTTLTINEVPTGRKTHSTVTINNVELTLGARVDVSTSDNKGLILKSNYSQGRIPGNDNYLITVPLTGIKAGTSITVTATFSDVTSNANFAYGIVKTSETSYVQGTAATRGTSPTATIAMPDGETDAKLYIGRQGTGSGSVISSLSITYTPLSTDPEFVTSTKTALVAGESNTIAVDYLGGATSGSLYYQTNTTGETPTAPTSATETTGWTDATKSGTDGRFNITLSPNASDNPLYIYAVGVADDGSTLSGMSNASYTVLSRPSTPTVTWNSKTSSESDISWDSDSPALSGVTISATKATGVIYRWASGKAVEPTVTGEEFASMSFTKGDNTFDPQTKNTTLTTSKFSGTNTTRTLTFYTYNESSNGMRVYQSAPTFVTWTLKGATVTITVTPEQTSVVTGGSTKFSVTAADANGTDITSLLTFTYSVGDNASVDASNLTVTAGSTQGTITLTASSAATTTYNVGSGTATIKIDDTSFDPDEAKLNVATNSPIYGDRDVSITNSQGGVTYYFRIDEGTTATKHEDYTTNSSAWQSYSQYISLTAPDETAEDKNVVVSIAAVNTAHPEHVTYSSYTYTMKLYDAPSVSFKANDADVATTSYTPPVTVTIATAQADGASDNTVKTYYYVRPDGNETTPTKDNPQLWTEYSGALTINETSTVYAYADGDGTKSSDITNATININDDRNQPGISWPEKTITKELGTTDTLYTGQVLNNINAVEVVYSSSNPTVASINQDGIVHINGAGTTVITATYTSPSTDVTDMNTYRSQATSYTLTVKTQSPELSFYSSTTTLTEGQSVPDGTVVKLNMKNFPANAVVMVALNGDIPEYPTDKEDRNYDDNFHYLGRGIPVFTADNSSSTVDGKSTDGYATIHVRIYDASTKELLAESIDEKKGTYDIKLKVESYTRPDAPTLSPTSITEAKGNATVLTTAESSTATGDVGNMVYAKYSNSLTYSPRVLLAERNISIDTTSVGVFSTVYNPYRRTTAIQIKENVSWTGSDSKTGTYDISSDAAVVYYHYTPKRHKTSINAGEKIKKDLTTDASNLTQEITPKYYVDGVESALPTNPGSAKYSVKSSNTTVATVSIDESTNKVTVTANAVGTAIITISTNQVHGTAAPKNDDGEYVGTQGYDAAETTVRVTVTNVSAQTLLPPTIEPPTYRVYHSTLDATITANEMEGYDTASDNDKLSVGDAYFLIDSTENASTKTYKAADIVANTYNKIAVNGTKTITLPHGGKDNDGKMYKVWMVSYNSSKTSNQYSIIDTVTYVYRDITVPDPVLTPGVKGIDNEYTFSGDSLVVTASVSMAGASVYYTIDTEGNIDDIDKATLYDGKERITLKRSCTVRAVAYYDGVYSHTVVYNYRKTKINIDYPFYIDQSDLNVYRSQVNNIEIINPAGIGVKTECRIDADGDGQWDRNTDKADDYKYYKPDDDNYDGEYAIRYTTGTSSASTPTPTMSNSKIWDEDTGESFTSNTTIKAFCYNVDDGSAGPVSTLTLTFNPGAWQPWEALKGLTCDADGKLYDQIIDTEVDNHNKSTARPYIRMTIGSVRDVTGTNKSTWSHGDVAGDYKGNRIEHFGDCDIIAKAGEATEPTDRTNAEDEELTVYNHSYAQPNEYSSNYKDATVSTKAAGIYESTFHLPAHGTFVRFEPERDGTVYIWCVMNGGMQWSKNGGSTDIFFNRFIKKRPVYLVDEQGHAVRASHIQAAGTLDKTNWNSIDRSKLLGLYEKEEASYDTEQADPTGKTSGTQKNKDFTYAESQDIYDMYNEKIRLVSDNSKSITDLVTTLNDGTHQTAAGAGTKVNGDNVIDGTGYCIPSSSYMKFAFPLKAGKTYFFFMVNSKVGISALGFKADNTADATGNTELELDESGSSATGSTVESNISKISKILNDDSKKDLTYDVTVKHSFTKGLWTTLVLPFSVSEKQLKKELGDGVDVIHFTEWDATNKVIKMTRHYYNQMIVAGTPVFIKPDKDIDASTGVKFEGVHIEKPNSKFDDGVENVPASSTDVHMTGNFDKDTNLKQNDFYINTRGRLTQLTKSESMNIDGMRAWLTGFTGTVSNAKAYVAIVNDSETGDVDGIIRVTVDEDGNITGEDLKDNIIYNLSGQIVTRDPSRLNTLPRGVYILNGKKVTVK